jgi:hypothetical protein
LDKLEGEANGVEVNGGAPENGAVHAALAGPADVTPDPGAGSVNPEDGAGSVNPEDGDRDEGPAEGDAVE